MKLKQNKPNVFKSLGKLSENFQNVLEMFETSCLIRFTDRVPMQLKIDTKITD